MSLTKYDLKKIIESLSYSKKAIEEYTDHPSYEFKQQRLKEIDEVLTKVRTMNEALNN